MSKRLETLKPGNKFGTGYIRNKILLFVCDSDKLSNSEIQDFLRDNYGIRQRKSIDTHLNNLKENKYLIEEDEAGNLLDKKSSDGKAHYWRANQEEFISIAREYLGSTDEFEFLLSKYAQECIFNGDFISKLRKIWAPMCHLAMQKPIKSYDKCDECANKSFNFSCPKSEGILINEDYIHDINHEIGLSDGTLKQMFKISPTALKKVLNIRNISYSVLVACVVCDVDEYAKYSDSTVSLNSNISINLKNNGVEVINIKQSGGRLLEYPIEKDSIKFL